MGWLFLNSGLVGLLNVSAFVWLVGSIIILALIHRRNQIYDYIVFQKRMRELAADVPNAPGLLPIIGNALQFKDAFRAIFTLTKMSHELKTGTFIVWFGPLTTKVVVTDPRDIEILMSNAKAAEKDDVYKFMEPVVINGLINGGGAIYRAHKKLMIPLINGASSITEHIKQFNIQSKRMVTKMEKFLGGREFDVHDNIIRCVADIVDETIFGIPGNAQDNVGNILMEISDPFLYDLCKRMATLWLWPDIIFNLTPTGKNFHRAKVEIHKFLDALIHKKKEEYGEILRKGLDEIDVSKKPVFDQIMVHAMKTNSWSDQDFRSELFTLFVGSHDTISSLCCFVALMLAMFPEVQKKAREEIEQVVGNRDITEKDAMNMKWMDCVIRETVRLFPISPVLPRQLTGDIKLATCTLPKGASVYILPFATHRDPKHWEEPEKFMPERFLPENAKNRHTWAFVPFSGGLRSCPGSKYGMICTKILIAQMIRHYQLSTTRKYDKIDLCAHIATRCPEGYPLSIKKLNY